MSGWQYHEHREYDGALIVGLRKVCHFVAGNVDRHRQLLMDCREHHFTMFCDMADPPYTGFPGKYRGSSHPLLRDYGVEFNGVAGTHPHAVLKGIAKYKSLVYDFIQDLRPAPVTSEQDYMVWLEEVSYDMATLFHYFLRVHPYADGNGHCARLHVRSMAFFCGFPLLKMRGVHPGPSKENKLWYKSCLEAADKEDYSHLALFFLETLMASGSIKRTV